MDIQERISILIQGTELAQKSGALTLDEAYYAKQAIDVLKQNALRKDAFEILLKITTIGQKKGVYSLRDAHFLYLATENYETLFAQQTTPANPPTPAPAPVQTGRKSTKKES